MEYVLKNYKIICNRRIRVSIVGCGRISKNHFKSIEDHQNDIKLVSICEIEPQILANHESRYNIKGYLDLEDMLENENIDLVAICTPSGVHADQTEICAKYGVNVMTEKPMATNWNDGLRMVKTCDISNIRLFVVKQNRNNPTLQLLKRAILERRFGKIYSVNINVFWTRPQEYYDQAEWRGTWEMDGGALMNQASHYVDLLTWLIGPIADVHAMTGVLARNIEVEDTAVLNIRWRSGALGSMNVTMLTYPKNMEGSVTILGEKGSVKVGGVAVNEIQHWKFSDKRDYDKDIFQNNYQVNSVYGHGHALYYKNIIGVLNGDENPETNGEEGLKSLEVLIAAYLSSRSGSIISLPLSR